MRHSEHAARQLAAAITCALVLVCTGPLFAGDTGRLTMAEKELLAQHELYNKLQKKLDRHPVTKWRRRIARNKKAIAILDKQLRDMVRLENEEQIEDLRRENRKLRKQIETEKEKWEALRKQCDTAGERLESLKKQIGADRAEEILGKETG